MKQYQQMFVVIPFFPNCESLFLYSTKHLLLDLYFNSIVICNIRGGGRGHNNVPMKGLWEGQVMHYPEGVSVNTPHPLSLNPLCILLNFVLVLY